MEVPSNQFPDLVLLKYSFKKLFLAGYRMLAPPNTPKPMHDLMLKCWQYDPDSRPHFDQILQEVDAIAASL